MGTPHTKFERIPIKTALLTSKASNHTHNNNTDPRSPSVGIKRTPVQKRRLNKSASNTNIHNTTLSNPVFLDPRSPSSQIIRTPLNKVLFANHDTNTNTSHNFFLDPRSPSSRVARTPISLHSHAHKSLYNTPSHNNHAHQETLSPTFLSKESTVLNGADCEERKTTIQDDGLRAVNQSLNKTLDQQQSQPASLMEITSPKVIHKTPKTQVQVKGSLIASPIKKRKGTATNNTLPKDFKKSVHNNADIENTPPNPKLQRKISTPNTNTPRTPLSQK